ncbi:GNAT family N-acetyltransferase [Nocardia goodfellowii]|uniref:GNAT superfamily N-acetyltransferase n=1 Tax=Nocardia goodfellowii TaxID=882446 RepID=A0ABS4QM55_9NOCA|nr:GNAT family N-acetyltransferase [Nocardia goodfellowii]MBP2192780.1 GNAT superfamily N-acetyltransferase [Nocardia goodfellowii]
MRIREYTADDWPQVWPIVRDIVRSGETFTYDQAMTEEQARDIWVMGPPATTVVAVAGGRVVGTANAYANRQGPGAHVSTASFMVAATARGQGIGTALCRHVMEWAKERGFAGMQFNAVADSNRRAIEVYQRLGFEIVGTVPGAFHHPALGRVGLHVMYRGF